MFVFVFVIWVVWGGGYRATRVTHTQKKSDTRYYVSYALVRGNLRVHGTGGRVVYVLCISGPESVKRDDQLSERSAEHECRSCGVRLSARRVRQSRAKTHRTPHGRASLARIV